MRDINWFCDFMGCKLSWCQKMALLLNRGFVKQIVRMRRFVENSDMSGFSIDERETYRKALEQRSQETGINIFEYFGDDEI